MISPVPVSKAASAARDCTAMVAKLPPTKSVDPRVARLLTKLLGLGFQAVGWPVVRSSAARLLRVMPPRPEKLPPA